MLQEKIKKQKKTKKRILMEKISSSGDPQPSHRFQQLSCGPTKIEMLKKNLINENRKEKKIINITFFLEILFQIWWVCSQAIGANGFVVGLAKLENIKNFSK